jgi:O-Antigen ligase
MQNLYPSTEHFSPQPPSSLGFIALAVLMAMLMGGASIVALGSTSHPLDPIWFRVRYGLVGLPLVVGIAIAFLRPVPSTQHSISLLLWVWLGFGTVVMLSGVVNDNAKALSDGVWFLLGVPCLFFYVLPRAMGRSLEAVTAWGLVLGHLPYGILSVVQAPPTTFPYTGIFSNSNQLGVTILTINCGLLILLNKTLLDPSKPPRAIKIVGLSGLILVSFVLIIFSNSRTALLGSLLGLLFALYPVIQAFQYPRTLARTLLFGMGFIGVSSLYWVQTVDPWASLERGYADKLESGDAFNGRSYIWQKTFEDTRLFGYGSNDYFLKNFDLGAHNSLIDILGQSGLIAFYLMIIIALLSFYYAYRYFQTQAGVNPYAIAPLLISLMFWTVSMAESMFGSLGRGLTIAYLLSLGIMLYRPARE